MNNQQVLLGQPIDYPHGLFALMKPFFEGTLGVKKAYLASIQYTDSSLSPKLLIGLDTHHELKDVVQQFEAYMKDKDAVTELIEFVSANRPPFQGYFSKITPFYAI